MIIEAGGITTIQSAKETHPKISNVEHYVTLALRSLAYNNDNNQLMNANAVG